MISTKTFWITGLPCSGKTTLAYALRERISKTNSVVVLDGDEVRKTLCVDLGYAEHDRKENIRRVASVCRLLNEQNFVVISALVSPYAVLRAMARSVIGAPFFEIYLSCPVRVCADRDSKGMYKMASDGVLHGFTGVSAPYQAPDSPELVLDSSRLSVEDEVLSVLRQCAGAV
jgi:adenylyl-sulfate kinase